MFLNVHKNVAGCTLNNTVAYVLKENCTGRGGGKDVVLKQILVIYPPSSKNPLKPRNSH